MQAELHWRGERWQIDWTQPIDLSIPLRPGMENVNCFYAPPPVAHPIIAGDFVGDTRQGGAVNFFRVCFTPHGNGTHTECVGHISQKRFSLNQSLRQFHFVARLVSIYPQKLVNGDRIIDRDQLAPLLRDGPYPALIMRTLPNDELKLRTNYSGTNPPYLTAAAMELIVQYGVGHLLVDLPSVDREADGGELTAHRVFWKYPEQIREKATITELIYVPESVNDGLYLLNLQITALELDASPSKPVIYPLRIIGKNFE